MEGSFRGLFMFRGGVSSNETKLGRNKKKKFLPEGRGSFTVCERQQLKVLCLVLKLCCMYTLHMLIQIQLTKFAFVVFSTWLAVCLSIRWLYYYLACSLSTE